LREIKKFYNELVVLRLNCKNLKYIPELPDSLKYIGISNCKKIVTLPDISFIENPILEIDDCDSLEEIIQFPKNVTYIIIQNCNNIKKLPSFPINLISLKIYNCAKLCNIPKIPDTVTCIYFVNTPYLVLPELSTNLSCFVLEYNRMILSLSNFSNIQTLYTNNNYWIYPSKYQISKVIVLQRYFRKKLFERRYYKMKYLKEYFHHYLAFHILSY
jgi:hypothetical protein